MGMRRDMFATVSRGLCAGAAATTALNITTYLDMLITGRPASSVPQELVRRLAERAGCDELATPDDTASASIKATRSTLGTLLGYTNGLGVATVAAMLYPTTRTLGVPLNAAAIGLAAMAAGDIPIAKLGVSNPGMWSPSDWLRDVIPHLCYGLVVALTLQALDQD